MRLPTHSKGGAKGIAAGFSSNLERGIAQALKTQGEDFEYETRKIFYTVPARIAAYVPDFILPNGVVVEAKGIWETTDRQKHVLLRQQYPNLDLRIVFSNSAARISKKSPTTYAAYCERLGIPYADRYVPASWLGGTKADAKARFTALLAATAPRSLP